MPRSSPETTLLAQYALASAYAWAQFPYDNLCDPENAESGADGNYSYVDTDGNIAQQEVTQPTPVVYCDQNWLNWTGVPFPPTSEVQYEGLTWMRGTQERLTDIYGWSSLAALVAFIVIFFGNSITRFLLSWFRGVLAPESQNQYIDFSSNPDMVGFVPQIKASGFSFPFLTCDIDQIDHVSSSLALSAAGIFGLACIPNEYANGLFLTVHRVSLAGRTPLVLTTITIWYVFLLCFFTCMLIFTPFLIVIFSIYDIYYLQIFDVPWEGMPRQKYSGASASASSASAQQDGGNAVAVPTSSNPVFSTIKYYPPPWKEKLAKEGKEEGK